MNAKFKYQLFILVIGILIMLLKFIAYNITNSDTIFSDALESIVNIVTGFVGLYSIYLASLPRDKNHPYGHGKIEFFSAGIEGILIIIAGFGVIFKSMDSYFLDSKLNALNTGILIIGLTAILNYLLGYWAVRKSNSENSIVLKSTGEHLKSDAITTMVIIIALCLINLTGWKILDPIFASLAGIFIIYIGWKLLRKSVGGLMDEADYQILTKLLFIFNQNRRKNWIDIHNLRVIQYGNDIHIDSHLTVPWYFNVEEAHRESEAIEQLVKNHFDDVEIFIHIDACVKNSCQICLISTCLQRKSQFIKKEEWTLDSVLENQKHRLLEP